LGCGNGILWKSNLDRIPPEAHILLSDFSKGMLDDAQDMLKPSADRFHYQVLDAQEIPYEDNSFDIVIANLMLYHIPDRRKAIHEISRVLKPQGALYASTFGLNNMKELTELVAAYNDKIPNSLEPFALAFGLENGKKQLSASFKDVEMIKYEDSLEVTEVQPLVNYVLSFSQTRDMLKGDELGAFTDYIQNIIDKEGKIKITKNSGMFIARNPL